MSTYILHTYDKERKITVDDDVRVRTIGNRGCDSIIIFARPGRHFNEDELVASFSNIDMAYQEGTKIQVRSVDSGTETKGKWRDIK